MRRGTTLNAVILSCEAAIVYAKRYSALAQELAACETDAKAQAGAFADCGKLRPCAGKRRTLVL